MRGKRGWWCAGLALGLAGCAGTHQSLVETSPARQGVVSKRLAWRGQAGSEAVARGTTAAGGNPSATADAGATAAGKPATEAVTAGGPSSTRTGTAGDRRTKFFPSFSRGASNAQAKAEFVRPAGRDLWAEAARQGAQARLERWREGVRRGPGTGEDGPSTLAVAMEVGPGHTTVQPRPGAAMAAAQPRPRAAAVPAVNAAPSGLAAAPAPTAKPAEPSTLPALVEPDVERTSATAEAGPNAPAAPSESAAAAAPAADTPPAPDRPNEPATPQPENAPEAAPTAETTPAQASEAAPASEATPTPEQTPALPTPETPGPATGTAADPAPAPTAAPSPVPTGPSADTGTAPAGSITGLPAAAPPPPFVPSKAQATTQGPAAPHLHVRTTAPTRRTWGLLSWFRKKSQPTPVQSTYAPAEPIPAPVAQGPTVASTADTPAKDPATTPTSAVVTPAKDPAASPAVAAAATPVKEPATATGGRPQPVARAADGFAGPAPFDRLFPAAYYTNPGADAAASIHEAVAATPTTAAPTTTAPTTTAAAGIASAHALYQNAQTATRWQPRLFSRLAARFTGAEELERHPAGCACGRHPAGWKPKGEDKAEPSRAKGEIPPAPRRSIGTEPGDIAERRGLVEGVAAQRFDEPAER